MPNELDFFKYAEGGNQKRKNDSLATQSIAKKRKIDDKNDPGCPQETIESAGQSEQVPTQRHRVTCKGNNVPEPADTFQALAVRYYLSSLLLANLSKHGYSCPTGIQSQGVPILLEVCCYRCMNSGRLSHLVARPCSYFTHWYRQNTFLPPAHHICSSCSHIKSQRS